MGRDAVQDPVRAATNKPCTEEEARVMRSHPSVGKCPEFAEKLMAFWVVNSFLRF